ncbi:hypothetical protein ACFV1F_17000 [Streptomyces sp. NPDC059590]|uniref:hypothetical protein n=1 Tax=Streptomyces sp. NPDC059590 TaxID=3346877 RepID=UPI0036A23550
MNQFARGFRLHLPDGRTLDGAQFPSGRCVLDDPERGLVTAAVSIEALLEGESESARVEWPDQPSPKCVVCDGTGRCHACM